MIVVFAYISTFYYLIMAFRFLLLLPSPSLDILCIVGSSFFSALSPQQQTCAYHISSHRLPLFTWLQPANS